MSGEMLEQLARYRQLAESKTHAQKQLDALMRVPSAERTEAQRAQANWCIDVFENLDREQRHIDRAVADELAPPRRNPEELLAELEAVNPHHITHEQAAARLAAMKPPPIRDPQQALAILERKRRDIDKDGHILQVVAERAYSRSCGNPASWGVVGSSPDAAAWTQ